jgi:hypothetical protein
LTRSWLRGRRFVVHNILHADDTPHSLALGVSIALFVAILPLVGIQMFLSVAIAALLRANKAVCVPVVWISNPLTMVPLYGGCLTFGRFLLGSDDGTGAADLLGAFTAHTAELSWLTLEFWSQLFTNLADLGIELWLGSFVIGLPISLLFYPLTRWLVSSHREKRRRRLLRRQLYRTQLASQRSTKQEVA